MRLFIPVLKLLLLLLLLMPVAGHANDIFAAPCLRYQVPPALALAIAQKESRMHPWAINVEGRSFYPKTKFEALALVAKAKGKSFDVGLMQVNSWWLKRLKISPELALEPQANVVIGVWILAQEIARHGLTWKAVASYHTPVHKNPARGRAYAASVLQELRTIQ